MILTHFAHGINDTFYIGLCEEEIRQGIKKKKRKKSKEKKRHMSVTIIFLIYHVSKPI